MKELIAKNRRQRFLILNELYKSVEGHTDHRQDLEYLSSGIGIKNGDFEDAYKYMINENLISANGRGYNCMLTHKGKKEIETIYSSDLPTTYFDSLKEMN